MQRKTTVQLVAVVWRSSLWNGYNILPLSSSLFLPCLSKLFNGSAKKFDLAIWREMEDTQGLTLSSVKFSAKPLDEENTNYISPCGHFYPCCASVAWMSQTGTKLLLWQVTMYILRMYCICLEYRNEVNGWSKKKKSKKLLKDWYMFKMYWTWLVRFKHITTTLKGSSVDTTINTLSSKTPTQTIYKIISFLVESYMTRSIAL